MFNRLQAYFRTENDAEDVRAKLNKVNVKNVTVDTLDTDYDTTFTAPLVARISTSPNAAGMSLYPFQVEDDDALYENAKDRNVILECEVEEEDFTEALQILYENEGYVDKDIFN
ncbi:hypothetical protein BN1058_00239 [Paraliobacillus sp. PM-2]|uniref:hypothetical protein n=1 Tax=Paraliobacillus sp. PM-2 TaxID=1462524 RepID=UPI00061C9659|nr:hypothetical protein [Paraliobacillus sp. PM-2]CQR45996.1 hypothetical protein BN1058_00239 [Paraliobacillus sp. PM-2]